ncbi:hypothetical protein MJO28_014703 [Puccinia striiformis f. sp. tritici]|uniref:Uncharacterized protein n=1 Tax=Puccinia striiformis f. sp. tritici TaxID=168172 RepID=A0ACC0DU87_9BASI|nr:hypothetical protein MJO28_014703 [Puccinia striiformis f. sp. tritici]
MASNMDREKLRMCIKWSMIAFFLLGAVGPLPVLSWLYISAYNDLRKYTECVNYDGASAETYSHHSLPQERFEHSLHLSITVYCVDIIVMILIYIPLLTISLRSLYQQSMSQAKMDAIAGSSDEFKQSRASKRLHRERQRLVYHALCVFISTAVFLPPAAWKVFNSKGDFVHDVTWNEGLSVPLSFTGNIILLILNVHSYQILDERKAKAQLAKSGASSQGGSIPPKRSAIKTLFLSTMDEEDIPLSTASEEVERGATDKYQPAYGTADYRSNTLAEIKIEQCTFSTST